MLGDIAHSAIDMGHTKKSGRAGSSRSGAGFRAPSKPQERAKTAASATGPCGGLVDGFDVAIAAQAAAYFAKQAGGAIDWLKLIKLMYLAERNSMEKYDRPMFHDLYFSMDRGPVPSMVYYLIDGRETHPVWSKFMCGQNGKNAIIESTGEDDFDHLSEANTEILDELWHQFADMDGNELADWTHRKCPEWQAPQGGAARITHQSVFRSLGKERASRLADAVENRRHAKAALATGG